MTFPMAHFGKAEAKAADWRKAEDVDPDDEEMDATPADVVKMLGFDPAK